MRRPPLRLVHDGPGEAPAPESDEIVPAPDTRLYLGGGGSADDEAALWQRFLRDGLRIAYWPFALEPHSYDEGHAWVRREASRFAQVDVELWRDLAGRDERDLEGIDLVWVGGGNTYALLDHVRRTDWVDRIRAHVLAGGAYYGSSAGAVLAGADIDVARFADPNDVGVTDTTGLRLLGHAIVRPHWESTPADRVLTVTWVMRGYDVLCIPEDTGLEVVDGLGTNPGSSRVDVLTRDGSYRVEPGESYRVARSRR